MRVCWRQQQITGSDPESKESWADSSKDRIESKGDWKRSKDIINWFFALLYDKNRIVISPNACHNNVVWEHYSYMGCHKCVINIRWQGINAVQEHRKIYLDGPVQGLQNRAKDVESIPTTSTQFEVWNWPLLRTCYLHISMFTSPIHHLLHDNEC